MQKEKSEGMKGWRGTSGEKQNSISITFNVGCTVQCTQMCLLGSEEYFTEKGKMHELHNPILTQLNWGHNKNCKEF